MNISPENFKPVIINWKSLRSYNLERFSDLIDQDKDGLFGQEWISLVSARSKSIRLFTYKVALTYFILLVVLYMTRLNTDLEIEFFGFAAKGVGKFKEFLLIVLSILGLTSSAGMKHSQHLDNLADLAIKKLVGNAHAAQFYVHAYLDKPLSFFDEYKNSNITHHGTTTIVVVLSGISMLSLLIIFIFGTLFMQAAIVYDIINHPAQPESVNWVAVIIFALSFTLSSCLTILDSKLPVKDYSNFQKLEELKHTDIHLYNTIWLSISKKSDRKQKRFSLITSTLLSSAIFCMYLALRNRSYDSFSTADFVAGSVCICTICLICPNLILKFRRQLGFQFIRKNPEGTPSRLEKFKKFERIRTSLDILVPLAMSALSIVSLHFAGRI